MRHKWGHVIAGERVNMCSVKRGTRIPIRSNGAHACLSLDNLPVEGYDEGG